MKKKTYAILGEPFVQFWDMFVVQMEGQAEAGSIFPLGMLAHSARGDAWSSDA